MRIPGENLRLRYSTYLQIRLRSGARFSSQTALFCVSPESTDSWEHFAVFIDGGLLSIIQNIVKGRRA